MVFFVESKETEEAEDEVSEEEVETEEATDEATEEVVVPQPVRANTAIIDIRQTTFSWFFILTFFPFMFFTVSD